MDEKQRGKKKIRIALYNLVITLNPTWNNVALAPTLFITNSSLWKHTSHSALFCKCCSVCVKQKKNVPPQKPKASEQLSDTLYQQSRGGKKCLDLQRRKFCLFSELQSIESVSLRSSTSPQAMEGGQSLKSIRWQPCGINQWKKAGGWLCGEKEDRCGRRVQKTECCTWRESVWHPGRFLCFHTVGFMGYDI